MDFLDICEALLKLGMPSLLLAFFIFHWLFLEGEIDRGDKHKVLKARLKRIKKPFGNGSNRNVRFVYNRWAWFGGGFYGLAGLWTFFVIEAGDLAGFLSAGNFIAGFDNGIVDLLISFLINQVANSIQALLWFTYWPGPGESVLIWIAAGYLGYWGGIELARRQINIKELLVSKAVVSGKTAENSGAGKEPEVDSSEAVNPADIPQVRED